MSDDTTAEATETPPETPADGPSDDTGTDTTPSDPKAAREAARYRTRLREAEAERDALAEKVTALRRAAVDEKVKAHKVPTEGFWASGVTLEELLDEDGNLDDEKVKAAADTAVQRLGLERVGVHMRPVPSEGRTTNPSGSQGWKAAFAPK